MIKTTASYLKERREYLGLTQLQVAKALKWKSAQFVSNIERGLATIPPERIKRFAKVYRTSTKTLIDYETEAYRRSYLERTK